MLSQYRQATGVHQLLSSVVAVTRNKADNRTNIPKDKRTVTLRSAITRHTDRTVQCKQTQNSLRTSRALHPSNISYTSSDEMNLVYRSRTSDSEIIRTRYCKDQEMHAKSPTPTSRGRSGSHVVASALIDTSMAVPWTAPPGVPLTESGMNTALLPHAL